MTHRNRLRKVVAGVAILGLLWIPVSIAFVAAWNLSFSVAASCMLIGMDLMCVAVAHAAAVGWLGQSTLSMRLLAIFLLYAAYGTILNPMQTATQAETVLNGAVNGVLGLTAFGVITYFNKQSISTGHHAR